MKSGFILIFIFVFRACANGQGNEKVQSVNLVQTVRDARAAGNNKNWASASRLWQDAVSSNPVNDEFWFRLGESLHQSGQHDEATTAFGKALQLGAHSRHYCAYNIAKCYAAKSDKANTLHWLQQAFDLGYRHLMDAANDPAFGAYKDDVRFKQIVGVPEKQLTDRNEGWTFDIDLVVREIKRRAPDPYRYYSEKQLDSAAAGLKSRLSSLTDIQVVVGLKRLMTMVGDGHTMLYAFYERPEFQQNLPFDVFYFKEGIYVTDADTRFAHLLGCQVIAFDGKRIEDILKGMDPIINRDNEMGPKVMSLLRLRTLPLLFGLGLIEKPDRVMVTLKDEMGNTKTINIVADSPVPTRKLWDRLPDNWVSYHDSRKTESPLYLSHRFRHYGFQYFEQQQAVYFQYNAMSDDAAYPYQKFCDSLFNFIEANDVRKLIIDMRLNFGGNTELAPYLIGKIISCGKVNRDNHLFGIIGRRTYSAAINLVGYLEKFTPIILVGEPTGSSPIFIGEDIPFELPYSKLMANVSDKYWQSTWPGDTRHWFSPFIYVEPSFEDFRSGTDPVLNLVLDQL